MIGQSGLLKWSVMAIRFKPHFCARASMLSMRISGFAQPDRDGFGDTSGFYAFFYEYEGFAAGFDEGGEEDAGGQYGRSEPGTEHGGGRHAVNGFHRGGG